MKPESAEFLQQAVICVARADTMLKVGLNEEAARASYLACFHTAQAYIFERTSKTAKSHHGVHTEFFRLTKDDIRVDATLRRFLSQAYEFKAVADYYVGEDAMMSVEQATDAIGIAKRFNEHFSALL